jgi:hypothetical protein
MLIGLSGYKLAGKDTVGRFMVEQHGFKRAAFADKMKMAMAAIWDIPVEQLEKYKSDPTCYVAIGWEGEPDKRFEGQPTAMWSPMVKVTLREFMKRYATEGIRDNLGNGIFVDAVEPLLRTHLSGIKIVVTDCREEHELKCIRRLGGKIVRIDRPGLGPDGHRSEPEPNPRFIDYTLSNDGTLDDLELRVKAMLDEINV